MEYYGKNNSEVKVETAVDNFITQCTRVFIDSEVDTRASMSNIFMVLLSDLELYAGHPISNVAKSVNSYAKMEKFVREIWDKFIAGEEIYGMKYKLLCETDIGYFSAYNYLQPANNYNFNYYKSNTSDDMIDFKRPVVLVNKYILVEV